MIYHISNYRGAGSMTLPLAAYKPLFFSRDPKGLLSYKTSLFSKFRSGCLKNFTFFGRPKFAKGLFFKFGWL